MEKSKRRNDEMKTKYRYRKILLLLFGLLLLMTMIALLYGAVEVSLQDFLHLFDGKELSAEGRIIRYVRVPRVFGAIVAGMGLALSGALIQTILNNPLAGPNIIGVNSGAGFAVVLCTAFFPKAYAAMPLAAFCGAFATVFFVYYLGKKTGASRLTIVLAGVAVNSLLNGATDAIYTLCDFSVASGNSFKIGGLSGINTEVLKWAAAAIFISFVIVLLLHNELEVFSLGEETAHSLGLNVSVYRFVFLMLAAVLSGAAVSFAGLLGFVGLIVPHIARILVGEECKHFLLASAILGALFLLACDFVGRTFFAPYELPVGIILSFVGAPFFIWLLLKRRRGKSYA